MRNIFIHESAIVDPGAKIGIGSKVWHFSHVMPGARIGEQCILGQNVFVGKDVVIGNSVKIQNNVSIYTGVIVDDAVFIGPSVVFTNVMNPRAFIERKDEFRATRIGYGASLGANSTIICGNKIGKFAFIGAGTVVTKDVPAYAQIVGNPGKITGWRSEAGELLKFTKGRALCTIENAVYEKINQSVRRL